MMMRKTVIGTITLFVVLTFVGGLAVHMMNERILSSNLKGLTEKWVGNFLHTRVHIKDIRVGFFHHVSLRGVEVSPSSGESPLFLNIQRVVIRFDWPSFLERNFRIPKTIFLESPKISFESFRTPGTLFETGLLESKKGISTHFEFEGGEIHLPWFQPDQELLLTSIRGRSVPKGGSVFNVQFEADLGGVAHGEITARGSIDAGNKKTNLVLNVHEVEFSTDSHIPITNLSGTVEISSNGISLHDLRFLFRGVPYQASGTIEHVFSGAPKFEISIQPEANNFPIGINLKADLKTETTSGMLDLFGEPYEFSGILAKTDRGFVLSQAEVNHLYQCSGLFNMAKGEYRLELKNEKEQALFDLSLNGLSARLVAELDHLNLLGHDVVTFATLDTTPNGGMRAPGSPMFDLNIETDYFVLEHEVLRDFHARAHLSPKGLQDILARWGNVSELRGTLSFEKGFPLDLVLRVGPLPLAELNFFKSYAASKVLVGTLEGKLDVRGPLTEPELSGMFSIESGKIGKFEYDRSTIQFSGRFPYLLLSDSKVWRGKHRFDLKGGLDFNLRNVFKGIQIVNTERIVIWNGLELSRELDEVALASESGLDTDASAGENYLGLRGSGGSLGRARVGYQLNTKTSVQLTAEENQGNQEYVTVGSTVQF